MRVAGARRRLSEVLGEEGGFTLSEMLVVTMILILVLFALYGIFDMSIRVFSFGNDKVESTENARAALERMEREIRAAFPRDPTAATPDERVLDAANSGERRITFWNDLHGDGKGDGADETISFYASNRGNLIRKKGKSAETMTALGPGGALEFRYYDRKTGAEISAPSAANEKDIGMVCIKLVVVEDGAGQDPTQELVTNVALRNRGA